MFDFTVWEWIRLLWIPIMGFVGVIVVGSWHEWKKNADVRAARRAQRERKKARRKAFGLK